MAPLCSVTG